MHEVNFLSSELNNSVFDDCDFFKTIFVKTNLT